MPNAPSELEPASAEVAEKAAAPVPVLDSGSKPAAEAMPAEFGGPQGPEPTRYGDWEKNGRCIDF